MCKAAGFLYGRHMDLSDLGKTIAKFAPLLGTALAGPGGAAIGSIIAAKFGGSDSNPEALSTLIQADPDAAFKLKEIESENEIELAKIALQQAQAEYQDRANARSREVSLSDSTTRVLAYILTIGLIVFILSLFYGSTNLAASEHDLAMFLAGILAKSFSDVTGYYFGSSNNANP